MKKPLLYDVQCGAGGCSRGYMDAGFRVVGIDFVPFKRYCGDDFILIDSMEFLHRLNAGEFPRPDAIHASPTCQAHSKMRFMTNAKKHENQIPYIRAAILKTGLPYVIENVEGARRHMLNPTMLCGTMFGLGTGDAELRRHRLFETNWPLVLPFGMHCKHGKRLRSIMQIGSAGIARDPAIEHRNRIERQRIITFFGGHSHDRHAERNRVIMLAGSDGRARDSLFAAMDKEGKEEREANGVAYANKIQRPASVGVYGNAGGASKRDNLLYFTTDERNEAMGIDWMQGGEISQAIPPPYTEFIGKQLIELLNAATFPKT